MNKLTGTIVHIESSEHMSMVDVDVKGDIFSSIVLETPETASYLKVGRAVTLMFKETEVSIGKNLSGQISLRNRFGAVIRSIEASGILAKVLLDYQSVQIVSVISARSAVKLNLKKGDSVEWLVKTNEVSLLTEKG